MFSREEMMWFDWMIDRLVFDKIEPRGINVGPPPPDSRIMRCHLPDGRIMSAAGGGTLAQPLQIYMVAGI